VAERAGWNKKERTKDNKVMVQDKENMRQKEQRGET
jgi:hypothetical protein